MAKVQKEVKEETVETIEKKKYIAKSVIVDGDKTVHPDEEIELTEEQAERLLELNVIEAPEAK